jgi:hypothetical protein
LALELHFDMGQQQTLLAQAQASGLSEAATKVLAQNAPSLLARLSPGQVNTPSGFQPGSENELIIPPAKGSSQGNSMNHFVENPYGYEAQHNEKLYAAQNNENLCSPNLCSPNSFKDEYASFPNRKAPSKERLPEDESRSLNRISSFATDVNGGYDGEERGFQARGALPPADMMNFSRDKASDDHSDGRMRVEQDLGMVTNPNGLAEFADEYHAESNVWYAPRAGDSPYQAYHGNANLEGPYDDQPPTNPSLSQQQSMPHQAPAFAYAPVNNTANFGAPASSGPGSPERQQAQHDITDRSSWKIGSIVEVYSDSACSWHVARVIGVNSEVGADVLTVQFIAEDGPKTKSVYRSDSKIVALGSRNGGGCELPPGFQLKASQSRPGQSVYYDATTGMKYSSADIAWTVHFERLAQQSNPCAEVTVANLADARLSVCAPMAPMGTALMEPPSQQQSYRAPHSLEGPASSCRSEGPQVPQAPQAMSLAQLMNMKKASNPIPPARESDPRMAHGNLHAYSQVSSFRSEMDADPRMAHGNPHAYSQASSFRGEMEADPRMAHGNLHAYSQASSFRSEMEDSAAHYAPLPNLGMPPGRTSAPAMPPPGTAPRNAAGKISLPSFDSNPRTSNQAAYLNHEAAYLQSLSESLEYSREAEQYNGQLGKPPAHASVPRREIEPAPAPVRSVNPQLQTWNEDPFSQWRR